MAYRYSICGIILILYILAAMPANAQPDTFEVHWSKVVDTFDQKMKEAEVVGGGIIFIDGNGLNHSYFDGYADLKTGRQTDQNTIFHWASITKTFTAIAVMQLRDRGLLSLDDAISDYLPEIKQIHNPYGSMDDLTLRMALNHSTGLRNATWPWGGNKDWHPFEPTEWSQLVAMFPYTKIEFESGSRHSYSNPAIIFLGKIIEQLSGDTWEAYVNKHILKPLEMHRSYFNHTPKHLLPYRTNSYQIINGTPEPRGLDFNTGITTSNGGLNAPLTDMVKYLEFLLDRTDEGSNVLNRASLEELWEIELLIEESDGIKSSVGLSFFIEEFEDMRVIGHTGTQWSNYSWFYIHPESGTAAISVTNTDGEYDMFRFRNEMSRYLFTNLFTLFR